MPSDPRISPDGSRVVFVVSPGEQGRRETDAVALDRRRWSARPVSSRPVQPMTAIPAGRLMAREFSSARIASNQEATNIGSSCFPSRVGKPEPLGELGGELSQPAWSPDGRWVAVLRKDPEPEAVTARKKERDDAIVVEEDPRFTRLWVVDVETAARSLPDDRRAGSAMLRLGA